MREMLKANNVQISGKTVIISGSGNVAIYACEKAQQMGAKVVAMCDSNGCVYDENGINLDIVKDIKEVKRGRIKEYLNKISGAKYFENNGNIPAIYNIKAEVVLPCATQNDINIETAKVLVNNGVIAVGEGANMPCTNEAVEYFMANKVLVAPGKAANAGGVATSALEMSQNSMRCSWSFEEVDKKLENIMINIFKQCQNASNEYNLGTNYVAGANISAFKKVSNAMIAQGII
jgi:glutamate dehydrogenase (NADP+)